MSAASLVIAITGGGAGIGASLTHEFAAAGHAVVICGRRREKLQEAAGVSPNIDYFECDVSDEQRVVEFAKFVRGRYGRVDVLINGAGLFGAIGRFDQTDSELWRNTLNINLFGTYLVSKHFLGLLLESRTKKIINFAGGGAFNAFPYYSAYAVSKAAVVRLSETMAEELSELGVQVNCVAPGFVATDIHAATLAAGQQRAGDQFGATQRKMAEGSVPMSVPVECVKFLVSPASDGLQGKTISASFDRWDSSAFRESLDAISASELYSLRRINLIDLDPNDELRQSLDGD